GTVEELMERAGSAVAQHALEDFGNAGSFTIVCGSGSNGGDGRVAARVLEEAGREVLVVESKPEDEEKDLGDPDVLIDALCGPEDNKYTAGHVVVVGGSPGMTGAPCLSALAAMRADAGYVTLAGPESAVPVFENRVLEAVKRALPSDRDGLLTDAAAETVLEL